MTNEGKVVTDPKNRARIHLLPEECPYAPDREFRPVTDHDRRLNRKVCSWCDNRT